MSSMGPKLPRCAGSRVVRDVCGNRFCVAMAGDVNRAARCRIWRFTTKNSVAIREMILKKI